ncbi:MAG: hypothetical protein FJ388_21050, partial [Verrucomicrobia bacterium]|nr:hypothetical protein [Verrucomicrobiota bacterium]
MKQTLRPFALLGLMTWLAACAALAADPAASFDDFKALQAYSSYSTNCVPVREQLESTLMALGNDRKALGSLQTKLLALLPAPETTHDARDLILRAVQRMGFCNNLQAVAALLTDAKLSQMA